MSSTKTPDFMDEVKNTLNGTLGTVIAIYTLESKTYLDVRVDDRIYWHSPIENWEVTVPYTE
jgi:hypothetical protein